MQRGRKSVASNLIALAPTDTRPRLNPPAILSTAEATLFEELAAANPHLGVSDVALLAAFTQAVIKTQRLAKKSDIAAWERAGRLALSLARSLRLTQQSISDAKTAGRAKRNQRQG